jgi:2-oxoglutarate ferredoxin oxidoreductase subunit delta
MKKTIGAIVVDVDRCKGCQLCIVACPKDVIALAERKVNAHGYPYVEAARPDDCIGCASCGIVCPDGCITVYRKRIEVEEPLTSQQK